PHDVRRNGDRLDVIHSRRAAIETDVGGEWRLQPRHALLAFEAFKQSRFFAADVGAGAVMYIDVEVVAGDVVLSDYARFIGLIDGGLQTLALADEFTAHIDVSGNGAHCETGNEAAFHEQMRIMPHDLAVLAGTGLGFVGIDDEITRTSVLAFLRHER